MYWLSVIVQIQNQLLTVTIQIQNVNRMCLSCACWGPVSALVVSCCWISTESLWRGRKVSHTSHRTIKSGQWGFIIDTNNWRVSYSLNVKTTSCRSLDWLYDQILAQREVFTDTEATFNNYSSWSQTLVSFYKVGFD